MTISDEPLEVEPRQLLLWELENPLKSQIGDDFFKQIPSAPGIYRLRSASGEILYVGKAKSLRTRLRYYKSKTLMSSGSRKLKELVRRVELIDFDIAPDEATALLMENELLSRLKPPYNVMNTRPESYPYIAFRLGNEGRLEMRFIFHPMEAGPDFEIYGSFKATGHALQAFGALLRQIGLWRAPDELWPARLLKPKTPRAFVFEDLEAVQAEDIVHRLRRLLGEGESLGLAEIQSTFIENSQLDDCFALSSRPI